MAVSPSVPLPQFGDAKPATAWQSRARHLEYVTLAWTAVELTGGLLSGISATSVSLMSFGAQSGIEFILSGVILWRLSHQNGDRQHTAEATALRWAGISFLAVAVLTTCQAILSLASHRSPSQTLLGLAVTCGALVMMPVIALGKRTAAGNLGSAALRTDAKQNSFCAYQAGIVLLGLVLYRCLGWWWADALAALILVPLMLFEGVGALRGRSCCTVHAHCPTSAHS